VTGAAADEAQLAESLRLAHRRVAALELDGAAKERASHRLLAISDAAKHDTTRAAVRLERMMLDLDEGRVAAAEDPTADS
jgi:hypothetical protein